MKATSPEIVLAAMPSHLNWGSGQLSGPGVHASTKLIRDLQGIFRDADAWSQMNPEHEVYRVQWWSPVDAGSEGGLFWGVTILQPGKVGNEYFMTHGHFHANRTRAEYYAAAAGKGLLLRMDDQRNTWSEEMSVGSLHYIEGQHAHRVVNVGDQPLVFWACWGSDAGYDYATIRDRGFGACVIEQDGHPAIVQHVRGK